MGRSTTSLRRSMRRGQVTVKTARAVARLHRRLLRNHSHQRSRPANAADLRQFIDTGESALLTTVFLDALRQVLPGAGHRLLHAVKEAWGLFGAAKKGLNHLQRL